MIIIVIIQVVIIIIITIIIIIAITNINIMELPQAKSAVRLDDIAKEFVILARRTKRETLATFKSKCLTVNDYVLFINEVGNMMAP